MTDLRRGVLSRSEEQDDELLSCVFATGLPAKHGRSSAEKVLVGDAGGVLTLWDRGHLDDQRGRIILDRGVGGGESLDVLALLPDRIGSMHGKFVGVGMGDGRVKIVRMGGNDVVTELRHDDLEGVVGLAVDVAGRLISGGGQTVKLWREAIIDDDGEGKEEGSDGSDDEEGSEGEDQDDESSDSEDERDKRRKRKKRKQGKGPSRPSKKPMLDLKGID